METLTKEKLIEILNKRIYVIDEEINIDDFDEIASDILSLHNAEIAKLQQDVKDAKGKSIFMELAAFDIEQKLAKHKELVEAQKEVISLFWQKAHLPENNETGGRIMLLVNKIAELESEVGK